MPFQNRRQERACWSTYNRDKKEGKTPEWDCQEFEDAGKNKKSSDPFYDYKKVKYEDSIKKSIDDIDTLIEKSLFLLTLI